MGFTGFLCKYKDHLYIFRKAWEAAPFYYYKESQEQDCILLATSDEEFINELYLKELIKSQQHLPKNLQTRYLINLICKRCGHRLTIEDTLYFSDTEV